MRQEICLCGFEIISRISSEKCAVLLLEQSYPTLTRSLALSECFWTTLEKPVAFESAMVWTITMSKKAEHESVVECEAQSTAVELAK